MITNRTHRDFFHWVKTGGGKHMYILDECLGFLEDYETNDLKEFDETLSNSELEELRQWAHDQFSELAWLMEDEPQLYEQMYG